MAVNILRVVRAPGSGRPAGSPDRGLVSPVRREREGLAEPPPMGTKIVVPTGYKFSRGGQGDLFGFITPDTEGWKPSVSGLAFVLIGSGMRPDENAAPVTLIVTGVMRPRTPNTPPPGVFVQVLED
jgi:hypothetical protein